MKKVRIAKNKIVKTTREIHFSPDNQFEKKHPSHEQIDSNNKRCNNSVIAKWI